MRDLTLLARHIIEDFPEFYPIFSERRFEFDGRAPQNVTNRNPLLRLDIGADGLKTGHTAEAGYGKVGLRRWMVGSVAERVVRRAQCPVLVLPILDEQNAD